MKRFILTVVCLGAAGSLLAQPPMGPERRRGEFGQARWARRPGVADVRTSGPLASQAGPRGGWGARRGDVPTTRILQRMTEFLQLTPDQQSKVKDILDKAKAELGESVGSLRELGEKTRERLREVLTEEQRAKLDKLRSDARDTAGRMAQDYAPQIREGVERFGQEARLRMALRSLSLTEEQRKQIDEIEKQTREKIKAIQDEVRPKIEAAREEAKKKIDDVLTPEQREQLREQLQKIPATAPQGGNDPAAGPGGQRPRLPKGRPVMGPPQSLLAPLPSDARLAYLPPRPPQPDGGFGSQSDPASRVTLLPPDAFAPAPGCAPDAPTEASEPTDCEHEQPMLPLAPAQPAEDVLLEIFA
ncbi:MAG: hypothetical protein N2Z21_07670 [Candidatus Sumerlaeaceae bacterium]|nr:hypothetical protein [Candidatus Sumerlaeaceae bacterium]